MELVSLVRIRLRDDAGLGRFEISLKQTTIENMDETPQQKPVIFVSILLQ